MLASHVMDTQRGLVFIVEDDSALRTSLEVLLQTLKYEVKSFECALEFLKFYDSHKNSIHTGCLILDVRMPGMSGLELQSRLVIKKCTLPIIFVTAHADVPMAIQALENGAAGFLTKPYKQVELLEKLNAALSISQARFKGEKHTQDYSALFESLTRKEREILPLIVSGKTNKETARLLQISDRTVEVHRARILKKLQCQSLAELVTKHMLANLS